MEQGVAANQRKFGENTIPQIAAQMSKMQNVKDTDGASNFGYTGKSKLIYQRSKAGSQRSKTGSKYGGVQRFNEPAGAYGDPDTRSRLSKAGLQRFNEELAPNQAPSKKSGLSQAGLSAIRSQKSKLGDLRAASVKSKPSMIRQSLNKVDEEPGLDNFDVQNPHNYADEGNLHEEAQDQVDEMPEYLESASEMKPTQSQISAMSGKTYISQLKK